MFGVEEPLERFFTILEPLQAFMGPVLVQLPPMLKFRYEVAEAFFSLLKKAYGQHEYVLEVRHDSWLSDESLVLLTQYGIGLVISQPGGFFPYSEAITAPNVYLRPSTRRIVCLALQRRNAESLCGQDTPMDNRRIQGLGFFQQRHTRSCVSRCPAPEGFIRRVKKRKETKRNATVFKEVSLYQGNQSLSSPFPRSPS